MRQHSRRRVLTLLGGGLSVSVAGCVGRAAETSQETAWSTADGSDNAETATETLAVGAATASSSSSDPVKLVPGESGVRAAADETDGRPDSAFGTAVSVHDRTVLIGAPLESEPNGEFAGACFVFGRRSGTWTQLMALAPNDGDSDDRFGRAVDLGEDEALIGAPGDEAFGGPNAGSAYVFDRSTKPWSQVAKLSAPGVGLEDHFGRAVALDGILAIVGAPEDADPNGDLAGAAYVFTKSGSNWSHQASLSADNGDPEDRFGTAVSMDSGTILVGAPGVEVVAHDWSGRVYVFERSGGSWVETAKLTPDGDDLGSRFGSSLVLDDDNAIIGAPRAVNASGQPAGAAYLFSDTGSGWRKETKLTAVDGGKGDRFGTAVEIIGDTAVIGAPAKDHSDGRDSGAAYVFERYSGTWDGGSKLAAPNNDSRDHFGAAVALATNSVVVSAPNDEDPGQAVDGTAYVFDQ